MSTPTGGNKIPDSLIMLNDYVVEFSDLPHNQTFSDYMHDTAERRELYVSQSIPMLIPHISMEDELKELSGFSKEVIIEGLFLEAFSNPMGETISGNFTLNGLVVSFYLDNTVSSLSITDEEAQTNTYTKSHLYILNLLKNMLNSKDKDIDKLQSTDQNLTVEILLKSFKDVTTKLAGYIGTYSKSYKHIIEDYDNDRVLEIELIDAETPDGNQTYVAVDMAWQLAEDTHEVCLLVSDICRGGIEDSGHTGYRQPITISPLEYEDRNLYDPIKLGEVTPYRLDPRADYDAWQNAVVSIMPIINKALNGYKVIISEPAGSIENLAFIEETYTPPEEFED